MIGPPELERVKKLLQDWQSVLDGPVQERHSGEHGWHTTSTTEDRVELRVLSKYAGGQLLSPGRQYSCL